MFLVTPLCLLVHVDPGDNSLSLHSSFPRHNFTGQGHECGAEANLRLQYLLDSEYLAFDSALSRFRKPKLHS